MSPVAPGARTMESTVAADVGTKNVSGRASLLRTLKWMDAPTLTRTSGPGIVGAFPRSANASVNLIEEAPPWRCQVAATASSSIVATPLRVIPAALVLSFGTITGGAGRDMKVASETETITASIAGRKRIEGSNGGRMREFAHGRTGGKVDITERRVLASQA